MRKFLVCLLFLIPKFSYADWTVIRQFTQGSSNSNGFTTSEFDATGANTLFYFVASYPSTSAISDSENNSISCLTSINEGGLNGQLCYVRSAVVSATMTVTVAGTTNFPCVSILAASNTIGSVALLDKQDTGSTAAGTELSIGSVVPDTDGEFIVSGLAWNDTITGPSVDSPFTLSAEGQTAVSVGNHFGCGLAYYEQPTVASIDPRFSWTGTVIGVGATGTFRDNTIPTCTGSSPSLTAATWEDIATCHTRAANSGDRITVSNGSSTVTTNTTITKHVDIVCATPLACNITDNTADASDLINITESTLGHTRLEGFNFITGTGNHVNPNGVVVVQYATDGLGVLAKNNHYDNSNASFGDFYIWKSNRGVIWDSSMVSGIDGGCANTSAFLRHGNNALSSVWTEVPYYGAADTNGDKNLYIEDNVLTNIGQGIDIFYNGRVVIRHNTITNAQVENHGSETGDSISGRTIDLYENVFERNNTVLSCGFSFAMDRVIWLRGGPALIHENVIPAFSSMDWTVNELIFTDLKLRRNAGTWACWNSGYPSPYQVGWGYSTGGTQAGTSGVFMDLEPVYLWGNTGAGNYGSPVVADFEAECGGGAPSVADYIQANRDYYLNTTKSGYTTFIYPHPLQGEGVSAEPVTPIGSRTRIRMK